MTEKEKKKSVQALLKTLKNSSDVTIKKISKHIQLQSFISEAVLFYLTWWNIFNITYLFLQEKNSTVQFKNNKNDVW